MKKFFTTVFVASLFLVGFAQVDQECQYDFENNYGCYNDYLWIDTISDTNNIWQIGVPQKTIFNSAYSLSNAIITDTINPYPVNDTSSFIYVNIAECMGSPCSGVNLISGQYKVNSDSLNDFGTIWFSPDNGQLWIDLLNDTVYQQYIFWNNDKPVFTGTSTVWNYFEVHVTNLGLIFNIEPGDTVLYRFTFISDSIQTNHEGLMFDDIRLYETCGSIRENSLTSFSSTLFPNPAHNSATIKFENPTHAIFNLQVFDITGRMVIEQTNIRSNRTELNTRNFPPGIYHYRLLAEKEKLQSSGKFVVE